MGVRHLSPLYHLEGSSNQTIWDHPAYGGVEVHHLSPLYHLEEGIEEGSRNMYHVTTARAWVMCQHVS
jgi:hypothetical protein